MTHFVHHWWLYLVSLDSACRDLLYGVGGIVIEALIPIRSFFFFAVFFLSSLFLEWREMRDKKAKKILEAHQSYDDNTTGTIKKISTIEIQRHQTRLLTTNGVGHMSCQKVLGFTFLEAPHVAYSNHRWWSFLVSLNSSYQYHSNSTGGVVIGILICFQIFFFYFFCFLSFFSFFIEYCI